MPSYRYERPLLPEPTASQQAACYRAKRLALSSGSGVWRKQYQSGDFLVTETWGARGLVFRAGDRRIDADEAIAMLPDPDLARGYKDTLAETAGAHSKYPVARNAAFGLAFGGLGLVLTGLGVVLTDPESSLVWPLTLGGAAVAITSIIPTILTAVYYDRAIEHDLDRHMFRRSEWGGRTVAAVRGYNQKIAADCGVPTADVPMTQGATDLLGPAAVAPPPPAPGVAPPWTDPAPAPGGP
jgi:hypothetical protein